MQIRVPCWVAPSCLTLCDPVEFGQPNCSSVHGDPPGENIRVDFHALLTGIFPTQGSSPGLVHCRQIFYLLSHQGSPRILEWVAYPFSRGSSWPRNQTRIFCTAGTFFTSWGTREARMQSMSCEMPGWMNHKLESRLLGELSTTLGMQMIPL